MSRHSDLKGRIEIECVGFSDIVELRGELVRGARCQLVRHSILQRGLADPYLISFDGERVGYAGVWNRHFPGRIMELFLAPERRAAVLEIVRALRDKCGARELEVQSNVPGAEALLRCCAGEVWAENHLFADGGRTDLVVPGATVRPRLDDDDGPHGDWVVELDGRPVAGGGFLTHYNAPYADLYLEVAPAMRGQGLGSYMVQELRRECRALGWVPAARCDIDNLASRKALERGGMAWQGHLLAGTLSVTS